MIKHNLHGMGETMAKESVEALADGNYTSLIWCNRECNSEDIPGGCPFKVKNRNQCSAVKSKSRAGFKMIEKNMLEQGKKVQGSYCECFMEEQPTTGLYVGKINRLVLPTTNSPGGTDEEDKNYYLWKQRPIDNQVRRVS